MTNLPLIQFETSFYFSSTPLHFTLLYSPPFSLIPSAPVNKHALSFITFQKRITKKFELPQRKKWYDKKGKNVHAKCCKEKAYNFLYL